MSTYTPLLSSTLTSTSSVFTVSNIPQTYEDLIVTFSPRLNAANGQDIRYYYNGQTAALYSYTFGTGYNAGSNVVNYGGTTGRNYIQIINSVGLTTSSNGSYIIDIPRYAKENINKTALIKAGIFQETSSYGESLIMTALWRSTSAINSITFYPTAGSFAEGSTLNVYGIGTGSPKAMGGDSVYSDGTYWIHEFKSSGTFTPSQNLSNVDYLVIAGGGGGANGGGGAGGYRSATSSSLTQNISYTITVGAGGAANFKGSNSSIAGSGFTTFSSTGGGNGGSGSTSPTGYGQPGGSGGGAANDSGALPGSGNEGGYTPVEGYDGGGRGGSSTATGGGGGSSQVGQNGGGSAGGNGGNGTSSSITGSSVTRAGGGGGGGSSSGASGGTGGGGNGQGGYGAAATAGTVNTGSGGGGGWGSGGGAGGSGIVIVRYPI